jgi:hypothetical protein
MKRFLYRVLCLFRGYILLPPFVALLSIVSAVSRPQLIRIGKLRVCGPPEFLDLCRASVERLATLDSNIYRHFTTNRKVLVSFDLRGMPGGSGPPWCLFINEAYAKWQTDGVIAQLVYMFYLMSVFPRHFAYMHEDVAVRATHRGVLAKTKVWLEAHNFPEPLAACFSEGDC